MSPVGLAGGLGQRLRGDEAGPGTQGHFGVGVVCGQNGLELLVAAAVGDQGLTQRLDDPLRVRLGARQGGRLIGRVPAQLIHPGVQVPPTEATHDGVDEGGRAASAGGGGQVHGGAHCGVLGHPHTHELVGP